MSRLRPFLFSLLTGWTTFAYAFAFADFVRADESQSDPLARTLAAEVRDLGWIIFSARSEHGDWDLFACRPDGSDRKNLTNTSQFSETAPRISRDGRRMLYRRLAPQERLDNNDHGTQGSLVVANSDGSKAKLLGDEAEYSWASWSPDGSQLACLSIRGVFFYDLQLGKTTRRLPRNGFFQQLVWSPDGNWLTGVSNAFGSSWGVGRMHVESGQINGIGCANCCTPDWFPDSQSIIYSYRPVEQTTNSGYGWTQLWRSDVKGRQKQLVYGEEGRHIYGGCVSPDAKYVLFTGNAQEDGDPGNAGAPMGLIRLADTPMIGGVSQSLRALHPDAQNGPVLTLPQGWEPDWTPFDLGPQ